MVRKHYQTRSESTTSPFHTGHLADTQVIEQPRSASQQNSTEMPDPGAAHKLALQKELQRAFKHFLNVVAVSEYSPHRLFGK